MSPPSASPGTVTAPGLSVFLFSSAMVSDDSRLFPPVGISPARPALGPATRSLGDCPKVPSPPARLAGGLGLSADGRPVGQNGEGGAGVARPARQYFDGFLIPAADATRKEIGDSRQI